MNNKHSFSAWQTEIISKLSGFSKNKPIKILDFGAGNGLPANFIQNAFFNAQVTAVDINSKKIQKLKKNYPQLKAIHIQNNLPFDDNSFDLIYAANTFHHIVKDKQEFWLQELFRVLKKDGKLIILELNPFNLKTWFHFKTNPEEKNAKLLNPYALKKQLKQFGKPILQFHSLSRKSTIWSKLPFRAIYTLVIHQFRSR